MDALTAPFEPAYMQRAWLELALLSAAAGAVGPFVVLRRLAFATHALGVGAFPGAVAALALGTGAFAGGIAAAFAMAGALALLQRRRDLDAAASTGLLLAAALALGSLLVSDVLTVDARVDTLLFGSLLGVGTGDVARTAAVAAVAVAAALGLGRGWLVVAFDRETAPALGFPPGRLDLALFAVLAVTVVAAVDAVGSLLVSALLVVPAAAARLLTRRLVPLAAVSFAFALVLSTAGLWLAYRWDAPPGATVALLAAGAFGLAFGAASLRTAAGARARATAVIVAAVSVLAAGCGGRADEPSGDEGRLHVVATTPIVADWARAVGGDLVEVTLLADPLVDPHDFEPGPSDAAAVEEADVVVALGAGFDEWAEDLVENAGGGALVRVAPAEGLRPPALAGEDGAGEAAVDPHFWHDPRLAALAVRVLAAALRETAPDRADAFATGADRYLAEVEALDRELEAELATIPPERRTMVTDHDAFGYLAARYGIEIVGAAVPSTSTAAEPNARETAELIETIRREGVRALFSESSVDPKLIEQIAAETGASVYPDLYGDTLGPPGSGAATYLEMMRHNASVLLAGLNGEADL